MKTISVTVSALDYEAFRRASENRRRPTAQLIREAMAMNRAEELGARQPLTELPLLSGHRPQRELPSRMEIYDEIAARNGQMPG